MSLSNTVKRRRETLHLGPTELARRAGMTRQALHRIEAGDYVPSVLAALKLARALSCRVEDLFELEVTETLARLAGEAAPQSRLQLARVGETLCAYPLSGVDALSESADALLAEALPEERVRFEPLTTADSWNETAVLYGCDPSLSLLCRHAAPNRVLLRFAVSEAALTALAQGEAHMAGLHLYDPLSGQSNTSFIAYMLTRQVVHLYTLWSWEQGLIVQRGNPLKVQRVTDLARPGLRLANRPAGAGSRHLLDAWLLEAGLNGPTLSGYDAEYATPLDLASAVAEGRSDVGVGPRAAAQAHGLDFVPLLRERFDLAIPDIHLSHPGVQATLQAARSPALRAELTALGGYDPAHSGTLIATLTPRRSA